MKKLALPGGVSKGLMIFLAAPKTKSYQLFSPDKLVGLRQKRNLLHIIAGCKIKGKWKEAVVKEWGRLVRQYLKEYQ